MTNVHKNAANNHGSGPLIEALVSQGINPKWFSRFLRESVEVSRAVFNLKNQGNSFDHYSVIQSDIELTQAEIFNTKLDKELLTCNHF